jgi:hypothetical protein
MGQVRHGSATTTHAIGAALQRSQASLAQLSQELGITPKTVAKWRKRGTVEDLKTGPKAPRSTTLTEGEDAMVVACPAPHAAATGRLPLCSATDDPEPDPVGAAPVLAAAWHLTPPGRRRGQAQTAKVPALSYRVLPHRHRRASDGRRPALRLRRHGPDKPVRLCQAGRTGREDGGGAVASRDLIAAVPFGLHTVLTDRAVAAPSVQARRRGASSSPPARATSSRWSTSSSASAGNMGSSTG